VPVPAAMTVAAPVPAMKEATVMTMTTAAIAAPPAAAAPTAIAPAPVPATAVGRSLLHAIAAPSAGMKRSLIGGAATRPAHVGADDVLLAKALVHASSPAPAVARSVVTAASIAPK